MLKPLLNNPGWMRAGLPRPAKPTSSFGEDFSLLIRAPRRYKIVRGKVIVLS